MSATNASFNSALTFALQRHRLQHRKGTSVPYITHVVDVAETLAYYYPTRPNLTVAGLLHDIVEDTETTLAEVSDRFGSGVAALVEAVTKPSDEEIADLPAEPVARWHKKREVALDQLQYGSLDAHRLKAADVLSNLTMILRDAQNPQVGDKVWERFKVGKAHSMWYYGALVSIITIRLEGEALALELHNTYERLNP